MEVPVLLIFFSLPSILYIFVRKIRGGSFSESRRNVGWALCKWKDILYAVAVFAVLALIAFITFKFIPAQVLESSSQYSGQPLSFRSILLAFIQEAFYIALGEEIFFRGFLGGWLFRRIGFWWGNLIQAILFLLPHLLLLNVSPKIWPIFIVQFSAGWLQGWLRYRSNSILPSWLVHTATNLISAISYMG